MLFLFVNINISGIYINENLINKLLWNVIVISHSINWINISCWLFKYVINICNLLVWIVEFLWINVIITFDCYLNNVNGIISNNNTLSVTFPHVLVNIVIFIVTSYDTISSELINLILYY